MLQRLTVKNFALIDFIEIDFGEGLNILTGETGAGKSIIIDSINMVLGNRISKDIIRTGQSFAMVEAFFSIEDKRLTKYLEENGLDDEELILSREINDSGKNVCRINGRAVSLTVLKEVGQYLIDIHGQHDSQLLLDVGMHLSLLDGFGGNSLTKIKNDYAITYKKFKDLENKIKEIGGDGEERERKLDLLIYQQNEIKAARLKLNEDEELEAQKVLLLNASKISTGITNSYDILYSGSKTSSIIDKLNIVIRELQGIRQYDDRIEQFITKIEECFFSLEEISDEIRSYKEMLEFNPDMLDLIEERLNLIFKLKKKYAPTITQIFEYCKDIEKEAAILKDSEELLKKYNHDLEEILKDLNQKALELSNARRSVAKELEIKIISELNQLNMKNTKFQVEFKSSSETDEFTADGIDDIEFLISPNLGEGLKPLSKIASGGELSRIMLAIKSIVAKADKTPTLIFDEIDIGISGMVAQMVGNKLSNIAKSHQVICITHLPQIASMSDVHYLIEKSIDADKTKVKAKRLEYEEKVKEIARIIGGIKITEASIKNAQEIIQYAQSSKKA